MKKNLVIRKFQDIYSMLSGKKISSESKLDFHIEDLFYERYYMCEMLKAYFAGCTIIFGIAEYELGKNNSDKFYSLLYLCSIFTIFLWLNIFLQELMEFRHEKVLNIYSKSENFLSIGNIYSIGIKFLLSLFHPNPIFNNKSFTFYNEIVDMTYTMRINDFFLIASFIRFYFIIRFMLYIQGFMSNTSNRVCKTYFFEKNFSFGFRSAFASSPLIYLAGMIFMAILCFSYSLKIFERDIQPSLDNLWNCIWLIMITFPTVGYGDMVPKSIFGRAICMVTCVIGLFFFSMIIVCVMNFMIMNKAEKNAQKILDRSSNINNLKESAKKVINVFRKISQSKYNLNKTMAYQTKYYLDLKLSLKDFYSNSEEYSFFNNDEDKDFRRLFVLLTCILTNYEKLRDKHEYLEKEFKIIKDKLIEINNNY